MHPVSHAGSAAVLVITVALTAGCGGGSAKKPDAAEASASAAIAALSSKLAALTTTTPAALPAPAATSGAPTSSAAAVSTGGLPVVPSGAALSSLFATPASSPPAPAASNLAAAQSQANAALGGALTQLDVSKQCAAIPVAQVRALVKATVGAAANFPLQCGWKGTNVQVSLSPGDTDGKNYKNLTGTGDHPISGLGDVAEWSEPVPGMTLPDVNARKGTLTCYVQATDVPLSTIAYTGKDPFFKITDADSLAYATQEAKLCADIFAAG